MKVFISYASLDADLAGQLAEVLEEEGLEVWDERREVLPGENWATRIGQGLEESDAMVVLFTPNSIGSDSVRSNAFFAIGQMQYEDRLVPVLVFDDDAPSDEIPWVLKSLNPVELPGAEERKNAFREIANRLKRTNPSSFPSPHAVAY